MDTARAHLEYGWDLLLLLFVYGHASPSALGDDQFRAVADVGPDDIVALLFFLGQHLSHDVDLESHSCELLQLEVCWQQRTGILAGATICVARSLHSQIPMEATKTMENIVDAVSNCCRSTPSVFWSNGISSAIQRSAAPTKAGASYSSLQKSFRQSLNDARVSSWSRLLKESLHSPVISPAFFFMHGLESQGTLYVLEA